MGIVAGEMSGQRQEQRQGSKRQIWFKWSAALLIGVGCYMYFSQSRYQWQFQSPIVRKPLPDQKHQPAIKVLEPAQFTSVSNDQKIVSSTIKAEQPEPAFKSDIETPASDIATSLKASTSTDYISNETSNDLQNQVVDPAVSQSAATQKSEATHQPEHVSVDSHSSSATTTPVVPPIPAVPDAHKLNINTATFEMLDNLPGVGAVTARAIVRYRDAHGGFDSLEDLQKVKGIGRQKFRWLEGMLTV
ncbi:ComEA family DNA-binding protein [Corynebacterium freiburgense]|uniref:ComEA family DNA-binding protein n=1 Tax=Corynebacterium freiburgense TaxID=556548 RepID=UPI0003FC4DE9|nr:helix-hairpin-helix domain-containing protein [Corynebacterium freiburgense]WJZ03376.1 ComE operon protein 1 [Corynebacterium freiburgense]